MSIAWSTRPRSRLLRTGAWSTAGRGTCLCGCRACTGTRRAPAPRAVDRRPGTRGWGAGRSRCGLLSCLHELGKHTAQALGMDEGDHRAVQPHPRLGINELEARCPRIRKRLRDGGDAVSDVVETRPTLGEEPAHWRVRSGRAQELDFAGTGVDERGLDSLFLIARALDELRGEG